MTDKCVFMDTGEYKMESYACAECFKLRQELDDAKRQLAVALGEISVLRAQLLRLQQHGYRREQHE